MKDLFFLGVFLLAGFNAFAHSPDLSTVFLVEQESGEWIVQLNSSLTAFEQEIHVHYSDSAYATPEEFRQLVVEYCKKQFVLVANGSDTLSYASVAVRLGHATDVVFQVADMPKEFRELTVVNTIFRDIGRSNAAFVILKKGYPKTQVTLNMANGFTESFEVGESTIEVVRPSALAQVGMTSWVILGVLLLVLIGGAFWR